MHPLGVTLHVVVEGRLQLLRDQTCGETPFDLSQGIREFETARTNACEALHIKVWEMCREEPELTTTPNNPFPEEFEPPGSSDCA